MPRRTRTPALLKALDADGVAVTREQIVERFGHKAFTHGRAGGQIACIVPGIYVLAVRATHRSTRLAACTRWLADRGAISGLAACHIYGLEVRDLPNIAVVIQRSRRSRLPSWVHTRSLTAGIPIQNVDGHRVVPLEYALIDAVRERGLEGVKGPLLDAIREGKTDSARILEAVRSLPRVKHRRPLVRFLENLKGGIHSYLEYLADTCVFNIPQLAALERQVAFWVDGKEYRVDTLDRETMTAIELDSRKHHGSEAARRRDLERDAALASIGILTLRFTYEQICTEPLTCRKRILATIAARRRQIAA